MERTCKYGHGLLQTEPGTWSFKGTGEQPFPGLLGMLNKDVDFTVFVHTCRACGYVELSDAPGNFVQLKTPVL